MAKLNHEGEVMIVAYADYMESAGDWGTIVGKGKTENEALRNALVNMCKNLEKLSNEIEDFRENLSKLMISSDPLNFDENPIIPIEGENRKQDYETGNVEFTPSGTFHNADLFVYQGEVQLGLN